MPAKPTLSRRTRRRLRRGMVLAAFAMVLLLLVLVDSGVAVPAPLGVVLLAGFVLILGWFAREAYLDARSRGMAAGPSLLAGAKGAIAGWWSLGG